MAAPDQPADQLHTDMEFMRNAQDQLANKTFMDGKKKSVVFIADTLLRVMLIYKRQEQVITTLVGQSNGDAGGHGFKKQQRCEAIDMAIRIAGLLLCKLAGNRALNLKWNFAGKKVNIFAVTYAIISNRYGLEPFTQDMNNFAPARTMINAAKHNLSQIHVSAEFIEAASKIEYDEAAPQVACQKLEDLCNNNLYAGSLDAIITEIEEIIAIRYAFMVLSHQNRNKLARFNKFPREIFEYLVGRFRQQHFYASNTENVDASPWFPYLTQDLINCITTPHDVIVLKKWGRANLDDQEYESLAAYLNGGRANNNQAQPAPNNNNNQVVAVVPTHAAVRGGRGARGAGRGGGGGAGRGGGGGGGGRAGGFGGGGAHHHNTNPSIPHPSSICTKCFNSKDPAREMFAMHHKTSDCKYP